MAFKLKWWKSQRNTTPVSVLDGDVVGPEPFRIIYERRPQPNDEVSGQYALVSMGLVPFSPIGPATLAERSWAGIAPPQYAGYGVQTFGMQQVAGSIQMQPLFDPEMPGSGFTNQDAVDTPPYERWRGR